MGPAEFTARAEGHDLPPYHGFVQIANGHPKWTGKIELVEKHLTDPLHWKKPQRVFVNSMSDLFHEALPDEAIDRVFAVMALCPQHTFQCLTKRPERMLKYFGTNYGIHRAVAIKEQACKIPNYSALCEAADFMPWPYRNVWLGVSCEDQKTADERSAILRQVPAALRFISQEPQLAAIDWKPGSLDGISWLIQGGESGPGARHFDIHWARKTLMQCRAAKVAYFLKQLGAKPMYRAHGGDDPRHLFNGLRQLYSNGSPLKDRKGGDVSEWPEWARVREFPR